MLPGPVFATELLTSARKRRYYVIRFLYGMALLLVLGSNYGTIALMTRASGPAGVTPNVLASFASSMFQSLMWVQASAVLGLTPALVARSIADEARRKTLHYLLASRLSGGEIVLGKLMVRLLHVGVLMAIGLPVVSLLTLFGGVDPGQILAVYFGTATTTFFLAAFSILISTLAKRPRDAIFRAYGLQFLWLALPPILAHLLPSQWPAVDRLFAPVNAWIYPTNPFWLLDNAMTNLGLQPWSTPLAWMCGLQLLYGSLAVGLAVWRLRPSFQSEGSGPWRRVAKSRRRPRWRLFPRPPCGDNPMLWKEIHVRRRVGLAKFVEILIGLGLALGIGYGVIEFAPEAFREVLTYGYNSTASYRDREELNLFLRMIVTCLFVVASLGIAALAAGSLTGEREGDTWISLVATDLTGREILLGKLIGAIWAVRWIVALNLALALVGLAAGALHPLGFAATLLQNAIFLVFAAALGVAISLRAKTTMGALGWTMACLLFLNGGYLLCGLPLVYIFQNVGWAYTRFGVTPMVMAMSFLSYPDLETLLGTTTGSWSEEMHRSAWACLAGTLLYAFGAMMLTSRAIARFDRAVGRPERGRGQAPPLKEPAQSTTMAASPPST